MSSRNHTFEVEEYWVGFFTLLFDITVSTFLCSYSRANQHPFRSLHPKLYDFLEKTLFFPRGIKVGGNHLWKLAGQYFSQKNELQTHRLNLNNQFMVGMFGMEMWLMTWNGCKMGVVPWPDWTNSCSREGQGWQEQEAFATIVWSMWIKIHKLSGNNNSALARILLYKLSCMWGSVCCPSPADLLSQAPWKLSVWSCFLGLKEIFQT